MLNQKHMKEILLTSQRVPADYHSTRHLLHHTLDALMFGGDAVLYPDNGETVRLPPAPTEPILQALCQQKTLMADLTRRADRFLKSEYDRTEYPVE